MRRFHLLVLLTCTIPAAPAAAETIGRLFFTPEQRATLDRLRQNPNLVAPPVSDTLTVNGLVQRNDGETTVWINGVPQQMPATSRAKPAQPSAAVPVTIPGSSTPARMKVGQTLDTSTGAITEKIQPAPPKPAPTAPKAKPAPSGKDHD